MTVTALLAQYGIDDDDDEFAASLAATLQRTPGQHAAPLTDTAMIYLAEHGGPIAQRAVAHYDAAATHHAQLVAGVAAAVIDHDNTLSRREIAERLGIAPTRVSHQATAGKLWADSRGRYPAWQVHRGRLLPGLSAVIAAIPADAHQLDIAELMTAPQDELGGRTPVAHLAAGGDPTPVVALLAAQPWW